MLRKFPPTKAKVLSEKIAELQHKFNTNFEIRQPIILLTRPTALDREIKFSVLGYSEDKMR